MTKLSIKYRLTDELIPYVNNSRTHSPEQVAQVAASIKEFGFTNPILIDEEGGIIAGHGRLMAAQKLGLDSVPTIKLSGLTEAQKKAYVIADNQLALNSGWDLDLLKVEIEGLKELNFDIDLIGFDDDFIDELLVDDSETDQDDESKYTDKIETPIYEPTGEMPEVSELVDTAKSSDLIAEIDKHELPDEIRDFLVRGAYRHDKFDFRAIAHYYANTDNAEVKHLIEQSAMIIIDYDKAIELGFIKMTKELAVLSDQ